MTDQRAQHDPTSFYETDLSALPIANIDSMPAPSTDELWNARRKLGRTDRPDAQRVWLDDAYKPVIDALNIDRHWWNRVDNPSVKLDVDQGERSVWAEINLRRKADPSFLADIGATPDEFRAKMIEREKKGRPEAEAVVARSRGARQAIVGFAADMVEGFVDPALHLDPFTLGTMAIGGGGSTVARRILTEAAANGVATLAQQPIVAANRSKLGENLTLGEAATNVGVGTLFGAILPAAVEGGAKVVVGGAKLATRPFKAPITDAEVVHAFEGIVPPEQRTPDEADAFNVMQREVEVAQTSPYKPGAATEAHVAKVEQAVGDMLARGDRSLAPAPAVHPLPDGAATGPAARQALKQRIRRAESSATDDYNEGTGAMGPYQFLASTWTTYYKRRFGAGGLSDAQIAAKRRDPVLNERLMDDMVADNSAALRRIGAPETAGSLYLMHFAGQGGASKILRAAPDTPIERLMSAQAIEKNAFLRGKSAADVIAWAQSRVGDRSGKVPVLDRGRFASDDEWRVAQEALVSAEAAERAARAEDAPTYDNRSMTDAPTFGDVDRAAPKFGETPEELGRSPSLVSGEPPMAGAPRGPAPRTEPTSVDPDTRMAVQAYVANTREALKPAILAERLGIDRAEAQAALAAVAQQPGGILIERRPGVFSRSRDRAPRDLLGFLADNGGVRDAEGHDLVKGRGMPKIAPSGGVLIRKAGMTLDRAREMAAEAGYFHDLGPDEAHSSTTVADFLEMMEAARDTPRYAREDLEIAADRDSARGRSAEFATARDWIGARLTEHGIELSPVDRLRAADLVASGELQPDEAISRVVNEHAQDALDALAMEAESTRYADLADEFEATIAASDRGIGEWRDGPESFGRDSGRGEARGGEHGGAVADEREAAGLNGPPSLTDITGGALDDPSGAGTRLIVGSLDHDLRALAAREDMRPFRLDDDSPEQSAQDILDEIDADEAAIKATKDCL